MTLDQTYQIVRRQLVAARALIAEPNRWTRFKYAKRADGKEVQPGDPRAVCWCSMGALYSVHTSHEVTELARNTLRAAVGRGVASFNDSSVHADVLKMFDDAIASIPEGTT